METYTCKVPFLMFHNMKDLEVWGIIRLVVLNEYMCKRGLGMLEDSLKNLWCTIEVQTFCYTIDVFDKTKNFK